MNRLFRLVLALVLASMSVGSLSAVAQPVSPASEPPLDLAAMVLTPGDLADAGLDDYGLSRSGYPFNGAWLDRHAEFRGVHAPGSLAQALLAAGLQREYVVNYGYSPDGEQRYSPRLVFPQEVEIQISEFITESGAADAFDILTPLIFGGDSTGDAVDTDDVFGDEQLIGRIHINNVNDDYRALALTFRIGHLIVRLSLIDNTGDYPELTVLETLGETLTERIDAGLDGDLPGDALSNQMPRFHHTSSLSTFRWRDGYIRIDGETIPRAVSTWASVKIDADYGDAIDVYEQWRSFRVEPGPGENTSQPDSTDITSLLARFPDDAAASDWMDAAAEAFEASSEPADIAEDARATEYGEQSRTFTYEAKGDPNFGDHRDGQRMYIQVGATVIVLDANRRFDPLTPALVDALAAAHVTCLEEEGCANPILLSPEATHAETTCPVGSVNDATDPGSARWCFEGGSAFSAPVLDDGVLYTWNSDGHLYAIEAETGDLLWRTTPGPMAAASGLTPMIVDDVIIVVLEDPAAVVAFDIGSGAQLWLATELLESLIATFTYAWIEDGLAAVASSGAEILWIDPESGDITEQVSVDFECDEVESIDDHANGLVFAGFDRIPASVRAADAMSGELVWDVELPGELESYVVEDAGVVYVMSDSTIFLLDAETGEMLEEFPVDAEPNVPARLDIANDKLILHYFSSPGTSGMIALDRKTGDVTWQNSDVSRSRAGVAVSGKTLYLPGYYDDAHAQFLFALDTDSGDVIWSMEIGGGESATPVLGEGVVYAAEDEGTLFAIEDPDATATVATPDNGDDGPAGDAGSGNGFQTFESPQYGFSLEYDSATWAFIDDSDPDDPYDSATFVHELGTVVLIGDPDYDDDELATCVEDYQRGLERAEGVSHVRELRNEGGEDDDSVWALFIYAYDDGESGDAVDAIRFISCRALDNGVTLIVLQDAPEETFDDLSDAREELLDGFKVA